MVKEVLSFIKWAGGKKQLLSQFKEYLPKKIDRYFEPFVGGGAMAFYILKNYQPKEIYLSDINEELITTYKTIKSNVEEVIKELNKLKKKHNKDNYYKIRSKTEKDNVKKSARFIYLNKTCFNGLYRVNSNGEFNVPIGSYKNPEIFIDSELREISKLLKKTKIKNSSFEGALKNAKKDDFIYLDPPYYPLKKGISFTKYDKKDFLEKEHKNLSELFAKLNKRKCKIMLSNSNAEFINKLYSKYNRKIIKANRMINCIGSNRGSVEELLIMNYK